MVLFDPGVSRKHARIFEQEGKYLVEDLGSANGTKVNGVLIQGATALKTGDSIVLGPVVFAFEMQAPLVPEVAGAETRIVNRATVVPKDRTVTESELEAAVVQPTRALPNVGAKLKEAQARKAAASAEEDAPEEDEDATSPRRPSERALQRRGATAKPLAKKDSAPAKPVLTAAERARMKREAGESLGGQLKYAWWQMSPKARAFSVAAASLVALLTVGGLVWLFLPEPGEGGPTGPEPEMLSIQPVADSFGYGPGVTWERPDMKVFDFEFTAPTRAVVVLHYQAQDISENEVSVTVNAVDQGFVPADVSSAPEREIEQVLSPQALKRNQKNQVVFDNVKNPPGREPWRIAGLWIEVVPIPEISPEQTVASAQEYAANASKFYDQREVGSENLFRAWKGYRDAWITLESLETKPELYQTVRFQMNSLKHQLDQLCSKLMLDVERSVQLKDRKRARQTLEEVPRYFPTREHRCHNLALQKMAQYDL